MTSESQHAVVGVKVLHYLTWREAQVTEIACDKSRAKDNPRASRQAGDAFVRMDGKRVVIDEERVTCDECKATPEYKRSAHYNEKIKAVTTDINLAPMNSRKSTIYEEDEPPPAEAGKSHEVT